MRNVVWLALIVTLVTAGCATYAPNDESSYEEPTYSEPTYSEPAEPAYSEPVYESPFVETYDPTIDDPEVTIVNNADVTIMVTLSGPAWQSVEVPPYGSQTIAIPAGTYSFTGSAVGVIPTSGTDTFDMAYRYTWTFVIVESPQ